MYNYGNTNTDPQLVSSMQNSKVYKRTLLGTSVEEITVPEKNILQRENPFVAFQDTKTGSYFGITKDILARGTLTIGSAGTGKTNLLNMIICRLLQFLLPTEKVVLFDTKGDAYREFGNKIDGKDCYVIGNGREYHAITRYWNIFGEMMPKDARGNFVYQGEESDIDAFEMASALFEEMQSQTQPIFPAMSEQIVASVLIYFMRKYCPASQHFLNNQKFSEFFMSANNEDFKKIYDEPFMKDQRKCLDYISNGKSNQTQGVNSYIGSVLRKVFIGPFAKADLNREFSMRELIKSDEKAVVFIEYDLVLGSTLGPVYKILIDQALKYALGGHEEKRSSLYAVIDEWPLLPKLKHMSNALCFGRSQGVKLLCGCQNIAAIEEKYQEIGAANIMSAFQTMIAFKLNDLKSRKFVTEQLGENYQNISFSAQNDSCNVQREGHTVEDWHLRMLQKGEAIVSLADREPFLFHFPKY